MTGTLRQPVYVFEGFRLDAQRRVLAGPDGEPIALTPRLFDTLLYMVERPGQLLEKDELLAAIWPHVIVEEHSLNRSISTLRRALGEKPGDNRFIATAPGRGYRFVASVRRQEAPQEATVGVLASTERAGRVRSRRRGAVTRLAGLTLIAALVVAWLLMAPVEWRPWSTARIAEGDRGPLSAEPKSIAVLPLLTEDDQAFAGGLTEEIIRSLNQLPLRVTGSASALQFREGERDLREISKRLGVDYVLDGSVRSDGGARRRVMAQLVRAKDGSNMWSEGYDRTVERSELFEVQRELAETIATALGVVLDDVRRERMNRSGTRNVEAFLANQEGWRLYTSAHDNNGTLWAANEQFERAMVLDPKYGEPALGHLDVFHHQLTEGANGLASHSPYSQDEALDLLLGDLERAIDNSPTEPRRLALEIYREGFTRSWVRLPHLVDEFRGAVKQDDFAREKPVWIAPSPVLNVLGQPDLVRALAERSLTSDPLNVEAWFQRILAELHAKAFASVTRVTGEARGLVGRNSLFFTAAVANAVSQRDRDRAIQILETAKGTASHDRPMSLSPVAYLEAINGNYERARALADEIQSQIDWPVRQLLLTYHEIGDVESTRTLARRIDELPGGSVIFVELLNTWGAPPFALDDTPNFRDRLKEAGVDLATLNPLPRLSIGRAER